jgi:hypothetical protein
MVAVLGQQRDDYVLQYVKRSDSRSKFMHANYTLAECSVKKVSTSDVRRKTPSPKLTGWRLTGSLEAGDDRGVAAVCAELGGAG